MVDRATDHRGGTEADAGLAGLDHAEAERRALLIAAAGIEGSAPVRVTFVPAQHFSGRGMGDRNRTLWGGFVIESGAGVVYFAGDTGRGSHFAAIRERFGPPRLALLPIGAYRPRWFMAPVHLDPRDAVEAHLALGAGTSAGIHHGTIALADDGCDEPLADLGQALQALDVPAVRFVTPTFGQPVDVPALSSLVAVPPP